MEVQNILHMNGGEGETSYAKNSAFQKAAMSKAKACVQNAVMDLYYHKQPKTLTVVDMGCSSGPNSLVAISDIIDSIVSVCQNLGRTTPEIHAILNDLHGNDFNTVFKSLPSFTHTIKKEKGDALGPCFISGVPGSFYGRLFPMATLDFVYSSYSLHILSQVPPGVDDNRRHVYIVETSPRNVVEAYSKQYRKDFTSFLESRSHEVVEGGRMVITIIGRRSSDPASKECCEAWELLAKSLRDMVSEGLVEEAKLASFHWPGYYPSSEEVRSIIEEHGSFRLDSLETFDVIWDHGDDRVITSGKSMSDTMRAVSEPMLASHFGDEIIDTLFDKYEKHAEDYFLIEEVNVFNLLMSLTKIV